MKIRMGFVSNSSSSSYTCDHCGETFSGWDSGLSEFDLVECEMGHYFCECHLTKAIDDPEIKEVVFGKNPDITEDNYSFEARYDFPSEFCPLCNLEAIGVDDLMSYYELRFGLTQEDILEDIQNTFGSYEAFNRAWIESRRNR